MNGFFLLLRFTGIIFGKVGLPSTISDLSMVVLVRLDGEL